MIFETHAHYDDRRFDADRDELLSGRLEAAGIAKVMNVAADVDSINTSNELSLKYENVYAALGVHPSEIGELSERDMEHIKTLVMENKKIRAIGEIGFDYHYDDYDKAGQERWFVRQIELAKELRLPIIVHSRDAAADTMRVISNYYSDNTNKDVISGVVHCYSYATEDALRYIDMGFVIGIGGVVTFKNSKKLKDVVRNIPLESIVLETDCPYLAPEPHRGERNSSLYLPYVVASIAELKGVSRDEVETVTYDNAMRLYGLA